MIPAELLEILRCPETGQTLALADADALARGNAQIARNNGLPATEGVATTEPLTEALVRADRKMLYPVRDGIPVLLVEEAIPL